MVRQSKKHIQGMTAEQEQAVKQKSCSVWGEERILTSQDEIDYYHEYIKQVLIKNKLVGSVSDSGNYNLKDRVKRDLVKMPKEEVDTCPGYYLAMAVYMKKTFNFVVDIEYSEDDIATASLYLNEAVSDYPPIKSLRSFVAKVVLPVDNNLQDKIFEAFNISKTVRNVKDTDVPFLAVQMQEQLDKELLLDEVSDLGSQIYIMRMLKVLSKGGKVGEEIVEQYKKEIEKNKLDVNKKGSYTKLHRILDEVIEKNGGLVTIPLDREVLLKPRKEYTDSIRKIDNAKLKKTAVDVKTLEEVEAGKPSGGGGSSKPAAKKPAAKKADKKKDDKKKKADKKKDDKKKDDKKKPVSTYSRDVVTTYKSAGLEGKGAPKTKIAGTLATEPPAREMTVPANEEPSDEVDAFDASVLDFIVGAGEDAFDSTELEGDTEEKLNEVADLTEVVGETVVVTEVVETVIVEEEFES